MTSAFSWINSISLCPASLWTHGQICLLLQVFLDFLLLHSSPLYWKGHLFFGVLVLESLVGLHRTIQLKLLQHYWSGHRLGFLWYWMVFLGNEERSFCHFWDCIQVPWTTFPLFYHWTLALKTLLFSLWGKILLISQGTVQIHFCEISPQLLQSELVTTCFYWP